jgi:hypothetical protein
MNGLIYCLSGERNAYPELSSYTLSHNQRPIAEGQYHLLFILSLLNTDVCIKSADQVHLLLHLHRRSLAPGAFNDERRIFHSIASYHKEAGG